MGRDGKAPSPRHKVQRVLSAWSGPLPKKAIPVAFPIRKVVYTVTERQPLELGLIERYVVDAARRFGPLPTDEIAGLLGLEPGLARRVALKLSGDNGAITWMDDRVTATPTRELPPHELVTHDRAFAVAAVGGALLPVGAVQRFESSRLIADGMQERFRTEDGEQVNVRGCFSPHPHYDGEDALRSLVNADPEHYRRFGLPLALVALGERQRDQEEDYWVESVLLAGDTCRIRPVAMPDLDLVFTPHDRPDFVGHSGKGAIGKLLDSPLDARSLQENIAKALPKARIQAGDREGRVSIRHGDGPVPIAQLLEDATRRWAIALLEDGLWWDMHTCSVVTVMPGDDATADAAAILRLRQRIKRDAASVHADVHAAWTGIVESVRASCAPGVKGPRLELDHAVASLRRVNDTRLQGELDAIEDSSEVQR